MLHSEGLYLGSVDQLRVLVQPWIAKCPPSNPPRFESLSWYMSTVYFNSFDNQCSHPFKTNGAFVYEPLPQDALGIVQRAVTSAPPNVDCDIWMQSFGGAMGRVLPTETAFFHREARFIVEFGGVWTDPANAAAGQAAARWANDLATALRPYTRGTYVNFVDLALGSRATGDFTYLDLYYGGNVDRLRAVKTAWDPQNLFQFQQSIPRREDPPTMS